MGKHRRSKKNIKRRIKNIREQKRKSSPEFKTSDMLPRFFVQYCPEDVIIALSVMQLWIPNISAIYKHHMAVAVFRSIPESKFSEAKPIRTYDEFRSFCLELYKLLLSNPMLEDFVPEPDWGEIKLVSDDGIMKVFYGGSIERITDFIEAFKIVHSDNEKALDDINFVLRVQNRILSLIPRSEMYVPENIDRGHLEIPSGSFWEVCSAALKELTDSISTGELGTVSKELVLGLGQGSKFETISDFGDKLMTGVANPVVALKVNNKLYPTLLRDSTDAVLSYWDRASSSFKSNVSTIRSLSQYLASIFPQVLSGPLFLLNEATKLKFPISTIIKSKKSIYFIVLVSRESVSDISKIDAEIDAVLCEAEPWGVFNPNDGPPIMLCDADGKCAKSEDVKRVYILDDVSTVSGMIPRNRGTERLIPLPDFVSITDSLQSINELDDFWHFVDENEEIIMRGMVGLVDKFAAFRTSHSVLVDGVFDGQVVIPPLMGGNWRYDILKERWKGIPDNLPDEYNRWNVASSYDGIVCLHPKVLSKIVWATKIQNSTIHFVFDFIFNDLDSHNGTILEFLVEVFADAISQRRAFLSTLDLFVHKKIIINCLADRSKLASKNKSTDKSDESLFFSWEKTDASNDEVLCTDLVLNLGQIQNYIYGAKDSSFQALFTISFIQYLSSHFQMSVDEDLINDLELSSSQPLRCAFNTMSFDYEVPDRFKLVEPDAVDYKIARKELAKVYNKLGISPGKYEGLEAKNIINSARNEYRTLVHELISKYEVGSVVRFAALQCDILYHKMDLVKEKANLSQTHVTNYNIARDFAEKKEDCIKMARNYRYLLEYSLSCVSSASTEMLEKDAKSVIGFIDWLTVLYEASDVLHNSMEECALGISHDYVPEIIYPPESVQNGKDYSQGLAQLAMGQGVTESDLVESADEEFVELIDNSFFSDLKFTFSNMLKVMAFLANWAAAAGLDDEKIVYCTKRSEVIKILNGHLADISFVEIGAIIDFLILDPQKICVLAKRDNIEADVPIWEHSKRLHRYSIKPLLSENDNLMWGVVSVYKACSIWMGNLSRGALPAAFDLKATNKIIAKRKKQIEKKLEIQAEEVVKRSGAYVEGGIDFHRRYPKDKFDDVGDYDVLAYWPNENIWLTIECKYNKVPFCLKDARRLRDYIYDAKKGHLAKIEKRRAFLEENDSCLRELLGWPAAVRPLQPKIYQLYVTSELMSFMHKTSPKERTEFVRIDCLDSWLKEKGLMQEVLPVG
ncbi:hypothetical protein [Maridesulfovibrio sp.]|uniref:hypothetical protein n=1 Tax=Maridesulfovibrio sp. TaxID=2795000 RepID=UPI0029CA1ECF|nr:hypothetical protein [Maridesulfovibrio sp.]